jgi:hypothetical protein
MNSPGAKKRAAADDQPTREDNLHNLQSLFFEGPGPLSGAAPTTVIQRGGRGPEEVDGVKTETSGGVMTETSGGVKTETTREVGSQDDGKKETERTWPTLRPK